MGSEYILTGLPLESWTSKCFKTFSSENTKKAKLRPPMMPSRRGTVHPSTGGPGEQGAGWRAQDIAQAASSWEIHRVARWFPEGLASQPFWAPPRAGGAGNLRLWIPQEQLPGHEGVQSLAEKLLQELPRTQLDFYTYADRGQCWTTWGPAMGHEGSPAGNHCIGTPHG